MIGVVVGESRRVGASAWRKGRPGDFGLSERTLIYMATVPKKPDVPLWTLSFRLAKLISAVFALSREKALTAAKKDRFSKVLSDGGCDKCEKFRHLFKLRLKKADPVPCVF